ITIEGCRFWLAPLPAPENGFPAGTVAGENAVDTKVFVGSTPRLTIRDTIAYGFRAGLIGNMAAYNLKESVDVTLDRVTIYDSEIALRLRGPATVTVTNAVIYDVDTAVRYEDNIVAPKIYSSTLGADVTQPFQAASSSATVIDGKNVLVLAASLPAQLSATSGSLAVQPTAFIDAANHDYHLAASSPAIDQGVTVAVDSDRDGVVRPQGGGHDVGAYERCEGACPQVPDAGPVGGGGDGDSGGTDPGGCCSADRSAAAYPALAVIALFGMWPRRRRRNALP
nr:hypothetical protein [Deltaproteobacteria bacterium]